MASKKNTRATKTDEVAPRISTPVSSTDISPKADMTTVVSEMTAMRAEMSAMRTDFQASLNFLAGKFDDFEKRLDTMETKLSKVEAIEVEVLSLRGAVAILQTQNRELEQRERRCDIEIFGLPERPDEDCSELGLGIARVAAVALPPHEIESARRVGAPREGRPRAVLLRLRSQAARDRLLESVRKRRGVNTAELGMPSPSHRLFLVEHLSPFYKDLLRRTKEKAREKAYAYVWTRHAQVRVRKEQGQPFIKIKTIADLDLIA